MRLKNLYPFLKNHRLELTMMVGLPLIWEYTTHFTYLSTILSFCLLLVVFTPNTPENILVVSNPDSRTVIIRQLVLLLPIAFAMLVSLLLTDIFLLGLVILEILALAGFCILNFSKYKGIKRD